MTRDSENLSNSSVILGNAFRFCCFGKRNNISPQNLPTNRKTLRVESLEERVLLAVSTTEFDQIRALHPDLGLTADMGDYNVIEITANQLSVANLKSAITEAGTTTKPDLIVLRTTETQNTITFTVAADRISISNIPADSGSVTIVGFGTNPLTIDANQKSGVMYITDSTIAIAGLTIIGSSGSAIYTPPGTTAITTITNSTISGNFGGGIYNVGTTTITTITNSTISGNSGDGIYISSSSTATIMNSTISGNSGGGIRNSGTTTITNSTISGNSAFYDGGGIFNSGTTAIYNTIVAKNSTDIFQSYGTIIGSNNLIGNGTNSTLTNGVNGNIVGTSANPIDPGLGELTEINGRQVHPLLAGSPALATGNISWIPTGITTDQLGNDRKTGSTVCIGAVEGVTLTPLEGVTYTITSLSDIPSGSGYTFKQALEAANLNKQVGNAPAGSFTQQDKIIFALGLTGTIYLDGKQLEIFGSLIIDASLASITIDANKKSRVIYIVSGINVELINLTITGGSSSSGGGIYTFGTTTITNSTISGNSTSSGGGGIYSSSGTTTITNSTISGNSASFGGGIYISFGTTTITNSTISGNSSGGGGIANSGTTTIMNSTVSGNSASSGSGGGIGNSGTTTITNSTISGNSAFYGGGGIYSSSGTTTITNSTISGNSASSGGGIYISFGTTTITNSTVSGNSAHETGGGIYNVNDGTTTIMNSTISGNSSYRGGGIYNAYGTTTITNSTVSGNSAFYDGGGIFNSGTTAIYNTIVAKNSTDIFQSYGTIIGSNNLIGNGTNSSLTNGVNGNIVGTSANPIDPGLGELTEINGRQVHPLLAGSPALATGNISWIPTGITTDQLGNDRKTGSTVCVGAVEGVTLTPIAGVTYTITSLSDIPSGSGYTFKQALDAASLNKQVGNAPAGSFTQQDKIIFALGLTGTIYLDGKQLEIFGSLIIDASLASITIDANKKSRVIYIVSGINVELINLTITGGTASSGGGIYTSGTTTITNSTISGNSASSGGGIYISGTTTIMNSTISGNSASSPSSSSYGGGIYTSGTTTITNSTISGNSASSYSGSYGGGIYTSGTTAIMNSTISGNSASYGSYGGGIYNYGITTIMNSTISGNSASYGSSGGGGIYSSYSITITNSTINGNSASSGGGIYSSYSTTTITNSTICGNSADSFGGGIYSSSGTTTITNSTISGNFSFIYDGGIYSSSGTTTIYNTIVAKNSTDIYRNSGAITGSNNLIGNGTNSTLTNGTNSNIVGTTANPIDPLFVKIPAVINAGNTGLNCNPTHWDLRLQGTSPAVNAGSNTRAKYADGADILYDLAGNARIDGETVDMGAYEYQVYQLPTPTLNAPTDITTTGLSISWNAITNSSSYALQYRVVGDNDWITISSVTSPHHIAGLTAGTEYEFQLQAIGDGITYLASDWSMVQTAWTLCDTPIGVSATVLGTTSIQLDWSATTGATGYIVEQSANGSTDWITIATPSANTFTKTGLTANTSYYYRVTAVNPSGYSATSQMINATTNDYIQLPTPTLNTPTTISTSGLLLSWNAISNASSYVLQYRVVGDNDWITISSVTSPHHIAGLTAGTEYEFQLQAIGDD